MIIYLPFFDIDELTYFDFFMRLSFPNISITIVPSVELLVVCEESIKTTVYNRIGQLYQSRSM